MINQVKQYWRVLDTRFKLSTLGEMFSRSQVGYVGPTFAYYVILTVFPIVISAGIIISITNVSQTSLITALENVLPSNIETVLLPILKSVLSSQSTSLLSLSVLFTLWTVSRVIAVFRKSFNMISDVDERISDLLTRLWSFIWLLVIIAVFVALMIGSNILTLVIQVLPNNDLTHFLQHQSRWFIWIGMWVALVMLNYFLPTKAGRAPVRFVLVGSIIELIMLNLLNIGFTWYAKIGIRQYDFYQSMSSIIVLLIWLNLIATILVAGFVLIKWITLLQLDDETRLRIPKKS